MVYPGSIVGATLRFSDHCDILSSQLNVSEGSLQGLLTRSKTMGADPEAMAHAGLDMLAGGDGLRKRWPSPSPGSRVQLLLARGTQVRSSARTADQDPKRASHWRRTAYSHSTRRFLAANTRDGVSCPALQLRQLSLERIATSWVDG